MLNTKRAGRIIIGLIGIIAVISIIAALSGPMYAETSEESKSWLSRFEGGPVSVTFITAPPEKTKTEDARLIFVEASGIVLRFPRERDKFFPYANIISVDPK